MAIKQRRTANKTRAAFRAERPEIGRVADSADSVATRFHGGLLRFTAQHRFHGARSGLTVHYRVSPDLVSLRRSVGLGSIVNTHQLKGSNDDESVSIRIDCHHQNGKRMRTFLLTIQAAESDSCKCGDVETAERFQFFCPIFHVQRIPF